MRCGRGYRPKLNVVWPQIRAPPAPKPPLLHCLDTRNWGISLFQSTCYRITEKKSKSSMLFFRSLLMNQHDKVNNPEIGFCAHSCWPCRRIAAMKPAQGGEKGRHRGGSESVPPREQ